MFVVRRLIFLLIVLASTTLTSCDEKRLYEDNVEFKERYWLVSNEPSFEFMIADSAQAYNLYYNVRNSLDYRWDRIFVTYVLTDSAGNELAKKLVYNDLFDPAGRPYGESGLGDLYDHQFPLLANYRFEHAGKYSLRLIQFSRQDTLRGVLAVGARVERAIN